MGEIEWVVGRLARYHPVAERKTKHVRLFRIGSESFTVCEHNPGSKQLKPVYVHEFIKVMVELGWYED